VKRILSALLLSLWASGALAGAYSFRAAGVVDYDTNASNALTPAAPAGKAVGDLLILYTATRSGSQTTSVVTGWTDIAVSDGLPGGNSSMEMWCRIADGTATDTPTVQWTGTTADAAAWIEAYSGDVYTDCSTIVAHVDATGNEVNTVSDLTLPARTISTNETLVIGFSMHYTTTASADATTITANGGLTLRKQHIQGTNASLMLASGSLQQTTAANYDGSDFTRDGTAEASSVTNGIVVSLKTLGCSSNPVITDVDTDETVTATQTNVVITGTGMCITQGAGSVTLRQGGNSKTLSVDSWSNTSIQVDMSGVGSGVASGLLYGSIDIRVTNNASNSDDQTLTVDVPSGTAYEVLSGGLVTLAWDANGNPNRAFGSPLDLQASSQLAISNAAGCTVDDIDLNFDGSLVFDSTCTSVDFDYSRDGLYVGTVGTLDVRGTPPEVIEDADLEYVIAVDALMTPIDLSVLFEPGEAALDTYGFREYTTATDRTDANGAHTDVTFLTVDSVSNFVYDDYLTCGSSVKARSKYVDPFTPGIGLWRAVTCSDNDDVDEYATDDLSVTGLAFDADTAELSGTPETCGVINAFVRVTDEAGLIADQEVEIDVGAAVPDVEGDDPATAIAAIQALCSLTAVAGVAELSETIPEGMVVSTDPAIGEIVAHDQVVTYVLSLGSGPDTWTVPNLVGMTEEQAEEAVCDAAFWRCEDAGLEIQSYTCGQGQPFLSIYSQSPAANTEADFDDDVVLVLVAAIVPDFSGMTEEQVDDAAAAICQ
jgi:hypothetical protein